MFLDWTVNCQVASTCFVEALDKIYHRNIKSIANKNQIQKSQSPLAGFVLADETLLPAKPASDVTLPAASRWVPAGALLAIDPSVQVVK